MLPMQKGVIGFSSRSDLILAIKGATKKVVMGRLPYRLNYLFLGAYVSVSFRQNIKKAYQKSGINYTSVNGHLPLLVRHPPNLFLKAIFPDGEVMPIHLTEERGYEDIDGKAQMGFYEKFALEIFPTLSNRLRDSKKPLLDCACGSGYGSKYCNSVLKMPIIGIDVDSEVIRYAKKRYCSTSDNLSFIQANATNLSVIKNSSISSIISLETIEHIQEPEKALKEFCRILDDDGVLFISSPDPTDHTDRLASEFHVKEFLPAEFEKMLSKYFSLVSIYLCNEHILAICLKPGKAHRYSKD